jgi:Protein of unknown function (DUF3570)
MRNDTRPIGAALAAATCALLGSTVTDPVQAQEEPAWDFNTALLYYGEDGSRVQDLSLNLLAKRNFIDDRFLTLGLTVDSLTGASPNGALPQSVPQTFTQPSGSRSYSVAPDTLPLDNTFHDSRVAIDANWQLPLGRLSQLNVGASMSAEFDYLHAGINTRISRDFNKRNTTFAAGLALAYDSINPVGGTPVPFDPMQAASGRGDRDGEGEGEGGGGGAGESKDVVDLVFGITQVLTRNFLVQVNYSYSDASGYLNDPYKILTVVDASTGDAVPLLQQPGIDSPSHLFLYEQRPDKRVKQSLYAQAKYFMNGKVLDLSYRYMTDDWQIDSHTVDLRLRWPIRGDHYLEPHLRFYRQTAAEFYRTSLTEGEPLPAFASADYRLGRFDAVTAGLKYGWQTAAGNDAALRLEWYRQSGTIPAGMLFGNQLGRDNYPDLNAIILQYSYRFGR